MFQAMNEAGEAMEETDRPLLRLLTLLAARGYRFVTPTPATHARVVARRDRWEAHDLAGVLGWSRPFARDALDPEIVGLLEAAGVLREEGALLAATVRVSSLGRHLFLHSAYPTDDEHSVFFGPDSYRFAAFIRRALPGCAAGARIVDIGTGAGVGGLVAADCCPGARLTLTDINPEALRLARINAAHSGVPVDAVECDGVSGVDGAIDVALANPPYIIDPGGRVYRDGGDLRGTRVALDMATAAAARLAPGGRLLLYTGSPIVGGHDGLRTALARALPPLGCTLDYEEIDPDVFGEELETPSYADTDRIAVIGAVVVRRGAG